MSHIASESSTEDLRAGDIVADRYEVIELIGRGAIGVVYKARHTFMDRIVAIKMLQRDQVRDEKTIQRFQQEAKAISTLNHPNIVTVFDFGLARDGKAFLVMDYIDGKDLDEYILEVGRLSALEALDLFAPICEALSHAHDKGIVHRDLKPGNVVLLNGSEPPAIKLVDFGMAKLAAQADPKAQKLTQPGDVFGSPYYMSPEQFAGGTLDGRSDIYSLGCLLYETLSGRPPHLGDDVMEVVENHLRAKPEPINGQIDEDIPEELEQVLQKMLAKAPEDRYQKVSDLLFEIKDIAYRLRIDSSRTATVKMKSERPPVDVEAQAAALADRIPTKASGEVSMRSSQEAVKPPQQSIAPNSPKRRVLLSVELAVTMIMVIGIAAGGAFIATKKPPRTWSDADTQASQALAKNDLISAEKLYMEAVTLAETSKEKDNPKLPKSLSALGLVYHKEGKYDLAESTFKRAIEVMKGQPGYDCAQLSPLLAQLGDLYEAEGKEQEAEQVHKRALEIINFSFGKTPAPAADCPYSKKKKAEAK